MTRRLPPPRLVDLARLHRDRGAHGDDVMAIGGAAVITMQKTSITGNLDARKADVANAIARTWVERLQRDAMTWTQPGQSGVGNNIANAPVLATSPTGRAWFLPDQEMTGAPETKSPGFDILGRDLPRAQLVNADFCVNVRLQFLTQTALPPGGDFIRADVRVIWPIGILNSNPGFCNAATAAPGRSEHRPGGAEGSERGPERARLSHALRDDRHHGEHGAMTRRARAQEGFTLIELTVSLVAGLIVALGIVGLSRDATHTFHEEMRSSVAEANLRTAIDRLRADLSRAGYMSTGNIALDPMVAKPPGTGNPITANPLSAGLVGLARLTSIFLSQGGSAAGTPLSAQQVAADEPRHDRHRGQHDVDRPVLGAEHPARRRRRLHADRARPADPLDVPDPRARRLGRPGAQQHLSASGGGDQFIVRLVDKTGHTQFLATCPGVTPPRGSPGRGGRAAVRPRLPADARADGADHGVGRGQHRLRDRDAGQRRADRPLADRLRRQRATAQYQNSPLGNQPLTATAVDPTKYDLVRTYIDAGTGNPVPGTTEIVAEYAVDLEFAFSVDSGLAQPQPVLQAFAFDSATNAGSNPPWAQNVVAFPSVAGLPGPQRIRSVRVRLVTRAAEPDRTDTVPVLNPTGPYTYRYCMLPPCTQANTNNGTLQFARTRTVTAEVALPNQSRNFY